MIKILWQQLAIFQPAEFLSARDLLQRALGISGLFLLAQLAGLREFTSMLNGTVGSVAAGWKLSGFLALIYILLYLAFVILVPVLVWRRCFWRSGNAVVGRKKNRPRRTAAGFR